MTPFTGKLMKSGAGFCLLIMLFLPFSLMAGASVRITWQPNTEPDLSGYKIYYGTQSRTVTNYPVVIDVGNRTQYDVSGLNVGGSYFFAVTAYDINGNESGYSLERDITIVDMQPPEIESVLCQQNDLVHVVFSESVEENSAEQTNNYQISGGVVVQSAELQSDQKTVFLYTTLHPNGTYTLTVNNVRDRAPVPNTIASNTQVSYSWGGNDETAPIVDGVELFRNAASDLLVITFSEALDQASALNKSNYAVSSGITIISAGIDETFAKVFLTTSAHTPGQQYTLTMNNIKDGANPPNTIAANTTSVYQCIAEDAEPPRLIAARLLNPSQLELEFSEGMNALAATNPAHYSITPSVPVASASLSPDLTTVTLSTAAHSGGTYTVTVSNVGDDATPSNPIHPNYDQLTYEYIPPDEIPPELIGVELINTNLIQITFSEALKQYPAELESNYLINPSVQVVKATLDVSEKIVLLQTQSHSSGTYEVQISNIKDKANNTMSTATASYQYTAPDAIPPEMTLVQLHGSRVLEVVFSEAVDRTSAQNIGNYAVSPHVAVLKASLQGDDLNRVFLDTEDHQPGQSYTLTVNNIVDRATPPNPIQPGSQKSYNYPVVDTSPPVLAGVTPIGVRSLEVVFNESVSEATALNLSNYTITPTIAVNAVTLDISQTKVILNTGIHQAGVQYTLTVQNIQDLASPPNIIGSQNSFNYTYTSNDVAPPQLVRAEPHGATLLEIAFSEPVDLNTARNKDNYAISGGVTVQSISASQSQMEVFLTTTPHISGNYTVTVQGIKDLAAIPNTMSRVEYQYHYTADDTSPPELLSVELRNRSMVQLIFDEVLNRATAENIANYSISNGIVVEKADLNISGKQVLLQTSEHVPGPYTITVENIADASSNNNVLPSAVITQYVCHADDNTPPKMLSAVLRQGGTMLVVKFDEQLDAESAEIKTNYVINNNIDVKNVFLSDTKNEVIIETSLHEAGNYILTVRGIRDASVNKNEIEAYSQIEYTHFPPDNMPPELVAANLMYNTYLELIFSEAVGAAEATNIDNYDIEPDVDIYGAILSASFTKVYLNTAVHDEGTYTITVQNVKDRAFEPNVIGASNSVAYQFTPPDTVPPQLVSVEVPTPMQLILTFDEQLSRVQAEDISNYSISPKVEIKQAYLHISRKIVSLETSPHQAGVYYKLQIANIEDRAPVPNRIETPIEKNYQYTPPDTTRPLLLSAKLQGANLLELVFNKPLEKVSSENRSNYRIDPSVEIQDASLDASTGMKVLLETTTHMPGVGYQINVRNVRDCAPIPNTIDSDTWKSYSLPISGGMADQTPPAIARIEAISSTKIDIVFTEPVREESAQNTANYVIDDSVTVKSAVLDSNRVRVHLTTSAHRMKKAYRLRVYNITDTWNQPNTLAQANPVQYIMMSRLSVSDLSRPAYQLSAARINSQCYTDRDYLITQMPEVLENTVHIRTANNDKTAGDDAFLTFEIYGDGMVYVAIDKNIANHPEWLSGWKATGDQIVNSRSTVYDVYSSSVQSGRVTLGGNAGSMDDNMYLVFLRAYTSKRSILANLNKTAYQVEHVSLGDAYYIDRPDYKITSMPDSLEDLVWIRTANEDKENRDSDFLSFTLNHESFVYIAYDRDIAALPKWLSDWQELGEEIVDSRGVVFDLFYKQYEAGDVVLGGNCGTSEDNMYLVLIQSIGMDPDDTGYSTLPGYFTLAQNYPNPFNPETSIEFTVHKPGNIRLCVFNVIGQLVKVLVDREFSAGEVGYTDIAVWDGTDVRGIPVATGLYLYRIEQDHFSQTRRMILMR